MTTNTAFALCPPNTRRVYSARLVEFMAACPSPAVTVQSVTSYLSWARDEGARASSLNQTLAAIKYWARANPQLFSAVELDRIARIPSFKSRGTKSGLWLDPAQTRKLLDSPKSPRDRAILALLLGCMLRRSELSALRWEQIVRIKNSALIMNLEGKGGRVRNVGVPLWAIARLESYGTKESGRVFELSASAIYDVVRHYAKAIGLDGELHGRLKAHDLRRTGAKLARDGGAPLETIQRTLGHSSIATTERYLGAGESSDAGSYIDLG